MQQFFDALRDFVEDHWIKFLTGLGLMLAGWVFGRWRARSEWKKKQFYDRLNISLNQLHEGTLRIRTISEKACADIFLNTAAAEAIRTAARRTRSHDPILPLPKDDYWFYLNAVLNEISEQFAEGQMRRDMGLPIACETYLLCLTSEAAGAVRTRKVRAMLVRKQQLLNLPPQPPRFESPNHSVRWETLNVLAAEFSKHPYKFVEVEICLAKS